MQIGFTDNIRRTKVAKKTLIPDRLVLIPEVAVNMATFHLQPHYEMGDEIKKNSKRLNDLINFKDSEKISEYHCSE